MLTEKSGRIVAARKLLRRSRRNQSSQYLVDGAMGVGEALARPDAHRLVAELFCTQAASDRHPELIARARQQRITVTVISERAAAVLSETVTPQGIVARCGIRETTVNDILAAGPRLLVVLVETSDPGNAGTIIRLADAVAASGVIVAGEAVDIYNPKTIRATTGSLFHLPVTRVGDVLALLVQLHAAGITTLATSGSASADLFEMADALSNEPIALLLGSEAHGLSADVLRAANHRVSLPLYGQAESLNLACAAAVALYAVAGAQRNHGS